MIAPFVGDCKVGDCKPSRLAVRLLRPPTTYRLSAARNFLRDGLASSVLSARNEGQQAVIEAGGTPDLCEQ
jgi:hypothetical protein